MPQFDASLGTLTGVSVIAHTKGTSTVSIGGTSAGTAAGTVKYNIFDTAFMSNGGTATVYDPYDAANTVTLLTAVGPVSGTVNIPGGFPSVVVGTGDTVTQSLALSMPFANLNDFVRTGSKSLQYVVGDLTVSFSGAVSCLPAVLGAFAFGGGALLFDGSAADVTYAYTPTPEPACLTFVACGGLVLLRRRHRAAA